MALLGSAKAKDKNLAGTEKKKQTNKKGKPVAPAPRLDPGQVRRGEEEAFFGSGVGSLLARIPRVVVVWFIFSPREGIGGVVKGY